MTRAVRDDSDREMAFALGLINRAEYPPRSRWLTGHAHIDLAWLWPLEETQRKGRRTFQNVVSLMKRYPELRFNQSSARFSSG